jgi:serine/threonine protein phosphatase PrpC
MIAEKDFAGRQTVGARENQQDTYAFATMPGKKASLLLVLADGMGGYRGGEEASRIAVETFVHTFHEMEAAARRRLKAGVLAANDAIFAEIEERPDELDGMGTTLVAVAATSEGLEWASVGDSALYLVRGDSIRRLNADHSMRAIINQQVQEGRLSAKEAATHPKRTQLLSALIGEEIALLDESAEPFPLQAGDIVLVASDGLDTLSHPKIIDILQARRNQDAVEMVTALLAAVKGEGKPKQDNTTVAIMKISEGWLQELKEDGAANAAQPPTAQPSPTRRLARSPRVNKNPIGTM